MQESNPVSFNMDAMVAEKVAPVRPLAPYIGGKRNLSRRLVERINAMPHATYAEAFVGMGGVFFRRDRRPNAEVINDWSEDVSTFFRVVQRHYQPFMDMLRWQVTSRAGFEKLAAMPPESLTDLERSARFLYLQRLAFGGHVARRNFGVIPTGPARFDVSKLGPMADVLRGISGRFILSLNDRPEVRRIFAGFEIEEVGVRYTIGGQAKAMDAREVIISG